MYRTFLNRRARSTIASVATNVPAGLNVRNEASVASVVNAVSVATAEIAESAEIAANGETGRIAASASPHLRSQRFPLPLLLRSLISLA